MALILTGADLWVFSIRGGDTGIGGQVTWVWLATPLFYLCWVGDHALLGRRAHTK